MLSDMGYDLILEPEPGQAGSAEKELRTRVQVIPDGFIQRAGLL